LSAYSGAARDYGEGPADVAPIESYTSTTLARFGQWLQEMDRPEVLDVGPVCGENISYWARRVHRLYVCDLFLRLMRDQGRGLGIEKLWRHVDYPAASFDGIVVWDLPDRLPNQELASLVRLTMGLLRPGGHLVVFALDEHTGGPEVHSFVIGPEHQVTVRPQPHLRLKWYLRQNREILARLSAFKPIGSYLYRNGLREFLFRRP